MTRKRLFALILACVMIVACFSGCGGTENGSAGTESPAAGNTAATTNSVRETNEPAGDDPATTSLPLVDETVTISLWAMWMQEILPSYVSDISGLPAFAELENRTGVALEYTMVPAMSTNEQFAIMSSADAWTDIVWNFKNFYTGGLVGGYEDGIIHQLDEYIDAYMPNYRAIRDSDENRRTMSYTDDGWSGAIIGYIINGAMAYGLVTRQDWLDELDMEVPVTYNDWYDMLTAYKVNYDTTDTLLLTKYIDWQGNLLSTGYNVQVHNMQQGINSAFFRVNGEVRFGPLEEGYYEYISMLHDWYAAGLISSDFTSYEGNQNLGQQNEVSLMVNGEAGVWSVNAMWLDTNIGYGKAENESFDLVALSYPVLNAGDVGHTNTHQMVPNYWFSITTAADTEKAEVICKWFDYIFSDEGYLLGMYGIEGESWEYGTDGKPHYTENVYNNPDYSFDQMRNAVSLGIIGLRLGDSAVSREYYGERAIEAWEYWYYQKDDTYAFPSTTTPTSEETANLNLIMADIKTYVDENVPKFITGEKDMSEWDGFADTIRSLNIDQAISIMQGILDRYNSRG